MYINNLEILNEFETCPWINFTDYDWSCLTKNLQPFFFKKNEMIYQQQDITEFVYIVNKGRVCISLIGNSGEEKSFFVAEVGCIFGEISVIDDQPNICYAMAVTDTHIYKVAKRVFLKELNFNVEFSNMVLKLVVKKTNLLVYQIKQLLFNDANYRVYSSILYLVKSNSKPSENGYELTLKFTHQEMAHLTGLSRVSVSNILLSLTAQGILDKEDGYIVINDISLLHSLIWDIGD